MTVDKIVDAVTFDDAMIKYVAEQRGPLQHAGSFIQRSVGAETRVAIGQARLGLRVGSVSIRWPRRLG